MRDVQLNQLPGLPRQDGGDHQYRSCDSVDLARCFYSTEAYFLAPAIQLISVPPERRPYMT